MSSHINVSIISSTGNIPATDIRIPTAITTKQLIQELENIFHQKLSHTSYRLKVANKHLLLADLDRLENYPITSGDNIEILIGGNEHD